MGVLKLFIENNMKRHYRFVFLIPFFLFSSFKAFSNNIANYNISVTLNPKTKTLTGNQTLSWTNTSSKAIDELQFHTYLNAFKDLNSSFMKESGGKLRNDSLDIRKKENFGYIQITKIVLNNQPGLHLKTEYIQPDNFNKLDETVLKISLPFAVQPGQAIHLQMNFTSKLPKIFARTGWAEKNYFMVGQWFPKIGVLEKDGKWNCHQFHADTEFYSDFGSYKVDITLPNHFIVGATGSKTGETPIKGGLKQITWQAEQVHDFAWAASPRFVEYNEDYKGIKLKVLMQAEQKYLNKRYFESVKKAIDYMQKHVGNYIHPTLTLIDPSMAGSGSGGMEYPTLITCGAYWGADKNYKFQEMVTIHEFVHQYFQGMLASNEFENSWMDEGFTQYFESRIMRHYYPNGAYFQLLGGSANSLELSRLSYLLMGNLSIAPIRMDAWKYPKGSYGVLSYYKPAVVLTTLENLIGQDLMDQVIKAYFKRFKLKHPTPENFFQTANEVVAHSGQYPDLNWFFEQTITGKNVCDYAVQNLKNKNGKGSFELKNLKNMKIPVKVSVSFENGKEQTFTWDGNDKKMNFSQVVTAVSIDPERKNLLDINFLNNSLQYEPSSTFSLKYAAKILFWFQNLWI